MTTQQLKDKFQKARYNRTVRTVVLVALLAILLVMYFVWGKMKGLILGLIIVVTLALGIHIADYDLDLVLAVLPAISIAAILSLPCRRSSRYRSTMKSA